MLGGAYMLTVKKTGGGPPQSPPKLSEEHEAVASMISGELSMGECVLDTLTIQDGHAVDEAGNPIMDVTLRHSPNCPKIWLCRCLLPHGYDAKSP